MSLLELADRVQTNECTHVAMEATGVYWKPVWRVLEGHAELVLLITLMANGVGTGWEAFLFSFLQLRGHGIA